MIASGAFTPLLAGGVGVYLLLSAVGFLAGSRTADEFVQELCNSRVLAHLTGAVAFFVGGAILLTRPGFDGWLSALLSLTALWWMAEGAIMLAIPSVAVDQQGGGRHFRRMNLAALPVGIALVTGAILQSVA